MSKMRRWQAHVIRMRWQWGNNKRSSSIMRRAACRRPSSLLTSFAYFGSGERRFDLTSFLFRMLFNGDILAIISWRWGATWFEGYTALAQAVIDPEYQADHGKT